MSIVIICIVTLLLASPAQSECIRTFQELERSLLGRDANINSMVEAIFPVNRQVSITAHVYYFFSDDQGHGDLDVELYHFAFRWSQSWVFLIIRPELLQDMSLYVYQEETRTIKIVLDPLCDAMPLQTLLIDEDSCHKEWNVTSLVHLVNKLNTHLKSYLLDNRLLGVDETNRGYSAYLFNHDYTKDQCVIGLENYYRQVRVLVAFILTAIGPMIVVIVPYAIVSHYSAIRQVVVKESTRLHYSWSIIIVGTLLDIAVIGFDMSIAIPGMWEKTNIAVDPDDKYYYYIAFSLLGIGFPVMDLASTIVAALLCGVVSEMKTRPIPFFITFLDKKNSNIIFVMHCTGIASIALAAQIMVLHSYFIGLAVIATPIHSLAFLIMYGSVLAFLVVLIKCMVKALHTASKAMGCRCVAMSIVLTLSVLAIIIFVLVLRAIILLVGEYRNNDGILSIIAPIALAIFLPALGFLGKCAVKCFKSKNNDSTNQMTDTNDSVVVASRHTTHCRETTI